MPILITALTAFIAMIVVALPGRSEGAQDGRVLDLVAIKPDGLI